MQDLSRQIEAIRSGEDDSYKKSNHRTVFHDLLDSKLPPKELEKDRLRDEALSIVTAGSDTTLVSCQKSQLLNPRVSSIFQQSICPTGSRLSCLRKPESSPATIQRVESGNP